LIQAVCDGGVNRDFGERLAGVALVDAVLQTRFGIEAEDIALGKAGF